MEYLIEPQDLVFKAKAYINGFTEMVKDENLPQGLLLELSTEVAEDWSNDWDEGQGFGSSDGTYMLKEFIDSVIFSMESLRNQYETKFNPVLEVVKK
jgi:hypothetical protein